MKWLALPIAILFLSCCVENTELSVPNSIGEVVQIASADGSIVLRPTMKYDIFECMLIAVGSDADFVASGGSFLSEEGLRFQSFARERISDELAEDIKQYIMFDGELRPTDHHIWPQLMRNCPTTNNIEEITDYINDIERWFPEIVESSFMRYKEEIVETVEKFWNEIFYDYYSDLYPKIVGYCKEAIKEVDHIIDGRFSSVGILGFMEEWSGHRFERRVRMVLYPNPFRMMGAYAVEEPGDPFVTSVKITEPVDEWITTPFHEFSHILLRDVFYSMGFRGIANNIEPTEYDESLFHWYGDMRGVIEEYCAAAFDIFLQVKAGFIEESKALQYHYYRTDLCLDLTEYLLKNHGPGKDIGETFLEFLRSRTG
jgi:hypothetical protein